MSTQNGLPRANAVTQFEVAESKGAAPAASTTAPRVGPQFVAVAISSKAVNALGAAPPVASGSAPAPAAAAAAAAAAGGGGGADRKEETVYVSDVSSLTTLGVPGAPLDLTPYLAGVHPDAAERVLGLLFGYRVKSFAGASADAAKIRGAPKSAAGQALFDALLLRALDRSVAIPGVCPYDLATVDSAEFQVMADPDRANRDRAGFVRALLAWMDRLEKSGGLPKFELKRKKSTNEPKTSWQVLQLTRHNIKAISVRKENVWIVKQNTLVAVDEVRQTGSLRLFLPARESIGWRQARGGTRGSLSLIL